MRIGAFQFPVTADLSKNRQYILDGMRQAAQQGARLLIFPECSLTGYPGEDLESQGEIDFSAANDALAGLADRSAELRLTTVFGMVEQQGTLYYNSAMLAVPNEPIRVLYRKRALWGWDVENFQPGDSASGTFEIDGLRFGARICFEIRFPEYFRELFCQQTDCNLMLFCDQTEPDSPERYDLIMAHLRTRAVENVTPTVSVNTCARYQTAPTAAVDEDGVIRAELPRHEPGLLLYDLERKNELSFGAEGRKRISGALVKTE